ncbi:MAG TPA: hypothetical protein VH834_18235 [Solirubrobacteraceae bacterium]|jgi:hypothetical protein
MPRLVLELALGNAAMQSASQVLEAIGKSLYYVDDVAEVESVGAGEPILDANGNTVGHWKVAPDAVPRPELARLDHSSAARALRALQRYDELAGNADILHRHHLIEAETELGALLGLDCTGEPSSWTREGIVTGYDHDGDTCPVHEWLVPSDQQEVSDGT